MEGHNNRVYRDNYTSNRTLGSQGGLHSGSGYIRRQGEQGGTYSGLDGVRRASPVRTIDSQGTYGGTTRYPQSGSYTGQPRVISGGNLGNYSGGTSSYPSQYGGTSGGYVRREGGISTNSGSGTYQGSYHHRTSPYSGAIGSGTRIVGDNNVIGGSMGNSFTGLRPAYSSQINSSTAVVLTSPYMDPVLNQLVRFNPATNEIVDARNNEVLRQLTPRKGDGVDIGSYTPLQDIGQENETEDIDSSIVVDNNYFQSINGSLFNIFDRIDELTQGNTVISPISIYMAFSILAEGVSGVSKQEVFEFFNFDPSEVIPPQELYYLLKLFNTDSESCQLTMANSAWVNEKIGVSSEYIDHISEKYLAKVEAVSMNSQSTKDMINGWVEENTGGKIKNLISELSPTTILMLINAVYFKGLWVEKFALYENPDFDGMFHSEVDVQSEAEFMSVKAKFGHLSSEDGDYVSLPYNDTTIKFIAYLPKEGFNPKEKLDLDNVVQIAKIGEEAKVEVIMPKFVMKTKMDMRDILAGLGCSKIFDPNHNTDFKDIFDGEGYISKVMHEARIEVNEEGTEAVAVTNMEIGITSFTPQQNLKIFLNRPFSFFLVDSVSSMILFTGVYRRPE